MIPHKTERGKQALRRLKTYEGCPPPYDRRKRVVVPGAMRVMCLKPGRKYCTVGRLSHEVGWKYQSVVRTLENKRKVKTVLNMRKRDKLKVIINLLLLFFKYNCNSKKDFFLLLTTTNRTLNAHISERKGVNMIIKNLTYII